MSAVVARLAMYAVVTALASTVLVRDGAAQCPKPDLLSPGPCCTQAQIDAPRVPNFKLGSLSICWKDCNVDAITACEAVWSSPTPAEDCRNYAKRLRLKDAAGVVKWNGRIKFRYSRTWVETDPTGLGWQVWRYLANGDLRPTAVAGPIPCPVPPCTPVHGNKVRFTGYVDYAFNCATGQQEFAWMLSHECDLIDHAPGFPRAAPAGGFHPDRSYTFVGPAAGFVVGALQPAEGGGGPFEAVRRIGRLPGTTIDVCEYEESLQHTLTPFQQVCLCGTATAPPQYQVSNLMLSSACGTTVTTPVPAIHLPGFISKGIGMWTLPFSFPGPEVLRWNAGGYFYDDPCTGITRDEVFFGVTTIRGWSGMQVPDPVNPGLPLPEVYIDQGNSLQGALGTTMNRPYRSDHIINLNH